MAISVFSDKERKPTPRQINHALGIKRPLWDRLLRFISSTYQIPPDLSYGGKNYGWNLWYRNSGKTLVSLYPQDSYFVAQIVLGSAQAEQALTLKLGKNVQEAIHSAPQLHDGRWLFIKVRSAGDVGDVERLLQIKKSPHPPPLA
ncbi:MAG TPA: DUF3788 domain-containing protein [Anaerolineales bacterium]|nr:DUF3788 domain-containing protein [Anaerolineales bacterium]